MSDADNMCYAKATQHKLVACRVPVAEEEVRRDARRSDITNRDAGVLGCKPVRLWHVVAGQV